MDPHSVEGTARNYLVGGILGVTAWKMFLVIRQIALVANTTAVPQALSKRMDDEDFQLYRLAAFGTMFAVGFDLVRSAFTTITRIYGGYPAWVWSLTAKYVDDTESRTLVYPLIEIFLANWIAMVFIIVVFLIKWDLAVLITFYTYIVFIVIVSTSLTYIVIRMTKVIGPAALLYAAIPLHVLELLQIIAVIQFMLPIFTKQLPADAKGKLDPVAKLVNYPVSRIFMIPQDATDFSPNAAYMGLFGYKAIVITESLLKAVGLDDTKSVLAHELGHWARGHMAVGITTRLFQTIVSCFMLAVSYGNPLLFHVFGFEESDYPHPALGTIICWQYVLPVINAVVIGMSTILSYFCEYQADHFAVTMGLGEGLINALTTLVSGLQRFPLSDSWFAAWFIGHPDFLDRVNRIRRALT